MALWEEALRLLGANGQAIIAFGLLAVALYWRKALGLSGILASWIGKLVFSAVVIGILILVGWIPGLNIDTAQAHLTMLLDMLLELARSAGVLSG